MEDFWIVGCVLMALFLFYVMYTIWQTFFCENYCDEYTEYNDSLDNKNKTEEE